MAIAVEGSRRPCAHILYFTCSFALRLLGYVVIKVAGLLHDDDDDDDDCYLSMCSCVHIIYSISYCKRVSLLIRICVFVCKYTLPLYICNAPE